MERPKWLRRDLFLKVVGVVVLIGILWWPVSQAIPGDWKGQIVDEETGKPLEGVVVLAAWHRRYASPGGWAGGGYYASEEVVTGSDGRFVIQSRWTFTVVPFLTTIKGPEFYIFKPGYGRWQFKGQETWSTDAIESGKQLKEAWDKFTTREGVVIELPPLKTRDERLKFYQGPFLGPPGDVPLDRMKRWKEAEDAERAYLGFRSK